jgi:hypothetical protein
VDAQLTDNGVTLLLNEVRSQGSGITGQRTTLTLALRFDQSSAGRALGIEISGQDDEGRQDPFTDAGTISIAASIGSNDPGGRDRDNVKPLTETGRLQRDRTSAAGLDDERTEGNVLATRCTVHEIDIGSKDGTVLLRLRGSSRNDCQHVRIGDYIKAEGLKEHELLYWIDELSIDR